MSRSLEPNQTDNTEDAPATDQLKDQFVAWFVVVMAGYYLLDYLHQAQKLTGFYFHEQKNVCPKPV